MESFGLRVTSLTNTTVHHENGCVWFDGGLHLNHFIKQGLFLLVSTRSINDNDLILLFPEESYTLVSNLYWIGLVLVTKEGALDLGSIHFELFESTSSKRVCANETDSEPTLHVVVRKFGTSGGLSRPLKSYEHDNVGLTPNKLIRLILRSKHSSKLLNDGLDDGSSHHLDRVGIRGI